MSARSKKGCRMSVGKNTLVQYVRRNNGLPYGVIVAVRRPDGEVCVDFSLCNLKKDKFTKERALEIAIGRAMRSKESCNRALPRSLTKHMMNFNKRVEKYYKTSIEEVITW
jgi:hypothetical protein